MWFFLRRKNKKQPPDSIPSAKHIVNHAELIDGMGDFSDLEQDDMALKFWLPEAVEGAIEELAGYYQVNVSVMVRMLLASYVYGRYAMAYMHENKVGVARRHQEVMFSRGNYLDDAESKQKIYKVPELGKSIAAIKVWLPRRLMNDLHVLAETAGVLLSRFVREILIGEVLGRGTLPERPELLIGFQPTPETECWDNDKPVAMRIAERNEIGALSYFEEDLVQSS